jgi:hypothetical protein
MGTQNSVKDKKRNRQFLTLITPDRSSQSGNLQVLAIVLPKRLKSRADVFRIHLWNPGGLFTFSNACWHYFCLVADTVSTPDFVSGCEER